MGAAFGAIISSLVNDIIMPVIGYALGGVNFNDLFISLDGTAYPSLAEAKAAGAATINYGVFINTIIDFIIVAFVLFLLVRSDQSDEESTCSCSCNNEGMPILLHPNPHPSHSLPELHV